VLWLIFTELKKADRSVSDVRTVKAVPADVVLIIMKADKYMENSTVF